MVNEKTTRHMSSKLILALFAGSSVLAACGSVLSPQQAQSQIQTSVAQTIEAQNNMATGVALTLTAMVPPMTATSSPTPTLYPTLTPLVTDTPFVASGGGGGGGGGGGSVLPGCTGEQLCCYLAKQVPDDWPDPRAILKVGDRLDVNFTFQNVGKRVWDPDFTWEYFKSAVDTDQPANVGLTTSSVGFQSTLGTTVLKKGYVTVGFEMTAPDFEGREPIKMSTRWALKAEGTSFCYGYSYIEVIRPGMTP